MLPNKFFNSSGFFVSWFWMEHALIIIVTASHLRFQRAGRPRKSGEEDSRQLQVLFGVKGEESESEASTMANLNAMPSL